MHIVASHGIWVRLLLPPYRGCRSVFDLDSMNISCRYSTNQIAFWQNVSWYSEATLIQWNYTFYKSFGLNDKQKYERWRIFTMSVVKRIFAIEQLSDIQFDTINNVLKGKAIQTGGGIVAMLPSVSKLDRNHWSVISLVNYHYVTLCLFIYRKGHIERPADKAVTVWTQIPWLSAIGKHTYQL